VWVAYLDTYDGCSMDGRSGKVGKVVWIRSRNERFFGNPKVGKSVIGFLSEQRIFGNNSKMW
jgi:hypothetical protein